MSYTYEKTEGSLVSEGDYEVILERINEKVLPSGAEKLALQFRIRSDIEQKYKNAVIFEDIWKEKDNRQFYNRKRLNQLLGTQKNLALGTTFETVNDIIKFLTGSKLQTHITIAYDEFYDKDVNKISYYKSSNSPDQEIATKAAINSDSDLPF